MSSDGLNLVYCDVGDLVSTVATIDCLLLLCLSSKLALGEKKLGNRFNLTKCVVSVPGATMTYLVKGALPTDELEFDGQSLHVEFDEFPTTVELHRWCTGITSCCKIRPCPEVCVLEVDDQRAQA